MAIPKLGMLSRLEDLKEVWPHEATSFTPWLASEENIALLADAIGVEELIVEAQEKNVGPFRADILCKDPSTDTYVLVENQLERTDHAHLGQILTYAAGLGACTIIWIARSFTSEHRATLDWLNEITDEKFHFFGLEVELWRIGDSALAPKFNVVCRPNDWSRIVQTAAKEIEASQLTPRDLTLRDFWSDLKAELERNRSKVRTQKPLPQSWTNAALGRTGIHLVAVARVRKRSMAVQVTLHGPNRDAFYKELFAQKEPIEAQFGEPLEWRELPEKTESQIRIARENVDLTDRGKWPEYLTWMRERLERLQSVFGSRARNLGGVESSMDADEH